MKEGLENGQIGGPGSAQPRLSVSVYVRCAPVGEATDYGLSVPFDGKCDSECVLFHLLPQF